MKSKLLWIWLCCCLMWIPELSKAQTSIPINIDTTHRPKRYQISLITCGVGDELYSTFGHSAIRIVDNAFHTDFVYNYGMFNFSEPNFYQKFLKGKLLYYVAKEDFNNFVANYEYDKRSVVEQVLDIDETQAMEVFNLLETNLLEENKYYKYDFLFDNCSTRIRDIFNKAFGPKLVYASVLKDNQVSYRSILNQYLANKPWERFGINLLLGARVDDNMTEQTAMFLPDMLHNALDQAKLDEKPIIAQRHVIVNTVVDSSYVPNGLMWLMVGIMVVTMMIFWLPIFKSMRKLWTFLLLLISGILGSLCLFMWLGTEHQSCRPNFNVFWALPLNLIVAFTISKVRTWHKIYAIAAIILIFVAIIIHLFGLQILPLFEILPFLIAMMYIYITLTKKASTI